MAIVGTAYVEIRAITNKLDSDIQSALNRSVDRAARDAGRRSGDNFRAGFNDGTRGVDRDAETAGRSAGESYARGIERSSSRVRAAAEGLGGGGNGGIFSKLAPDGEANRAGQAMRRVALQMDGLASVAGVAIGSLASLGSSLFSVGASAAAASRSLIVLPSIIGAVIQGAITSAVAFQGIGAALKANTKLQQASDRVSTGSAATAAANAKAQQSAARAVQTAQERLADTVRNNAYSSEQASRRVRDSQQKLADTVQENARNSIQAARRVNSAQQDLSDTYESTAASIVSAQRGVRDAERALADAQKNSLRAQEALSDARKSAIEDLQQLTFSTEDAALGERRAALQLEDARAELAKVANLPIDSKARREAQLAYDEANLNVREATDRYADLRQSLADAAGAGVEGSQKVVQARENEAEAAQKVVDAQESVADSQARLAKEQVDAQREIASAQQKVADALEEQTRTQQSNARDLADAQQAVADALQEQQRQAEDNSRALIDAQRGVADAQQSVADAVSNAGNAAAGSTAALDAYNAAMANLSPQARDFVKYLISIQDELKAVRNAAGEELFPALTTALKTIMGNGSLTLLANALRETGGAIGSVAITAANLTSSPFFRGNFSAVASTNASTIRILGEAAVVLAGYLVALFAAAGPLIDRFDNFVLSLSRTQAATLDTGDEMQAMTSKFQRAGDIAAQFGRIADNLWQGIKNLGTAAQPAGQFLLDAFENATNGLKDLDSAANQSTLSKYFSDAATNTVALMGLFKDLGGVLLGLGDDPAIAQIATQLRNELVPVLDDILNHATSDVGPQLATTLVAVANAFNALSQTGALTTFLGLITDFANTITSLLNGPAGPLLTFVINLEAALAALAIIRNFSGIGYLAGAIGSLGSAAAAVGTAGGPLFLLSSKLDEIPGIGRTLSRALDGPILKFGELGGISGIASSALSRIGSVFTSLGGLIGRVLTPLFAPLIAGIRGVGGALAVAFDTNPIGLIITAVALLVTGLILAYQHSETFRNIVNGALSAVGDAAQYVFNTVLLPAFRYLQDQFGQVGRAAQQFYSAYLKPVFDGIGEVVSFVWDNILKPIFGFYVLEFRAIQAVAEVLGRALGATFSFIGDAFSAMWNNFLKPIIDYIGYIFQFVFGEVIPAVFELFMAITQRVFGAVIALAGDLISGAFHAIEDAVNFMWTSVLQPVFNLIGRGWQLLVQGIQYYWNNVLTPVWNAVQTAANYMYDNVLRPVFQYIYDRWNEMILGFQIIWNTVLRPTWDAIQTAANALYNAYLKPVFSAIATAWSNLVNGIRDAYNNTLSVVFSTLHTAVDALGGYFNSAVKAIETAWNRLQDIAKAPVRFVVNTVINDGLIDNFNGLARTFGTSEIPRLKLPPGFANGGKIKGYSPNKRADNVPIMATAGEFMHPVDTVQYYGADFMEALRRRQIPKNAVKGYRNGGLIALGKRFQQLGAKVTENRAFGDGRIGKHAVGSRHYDPNPDNAALDVNTRAGESLREQLELAPLAALAAAEGFRTIFKEAGHYDHLHVDTGSTLVSKITAGLTNLASSAGSLLTAPIDALKSKVTGLLGQVGDSPFAKLAAEIPKKLLQGATDKLLGLVGLGGGSGGGAPSGDAVTRWSSLVKSTLGELGLSQSDDMVNRVLRQIKTESGGNPNAIQGNIGDVNNRSGDLAKGLMQVIGATFRAYAGPYLSLGQLNPHASIYAGLNYAKKRYGSSLSFLGNGHGYDSGGVANGIGVMPKYTIKPERVLSPRQTQAFENLVPILSSIPRLAAGGTIDPRAGGTLAMLAEAGRAERVQPLGTDGLTEGERQIIALLSELNQGTTISTTINPPREMDTVTLARLISRELGWQMGA